MPTGPRFLLACYFDVSDISFALLSLDSNNVEFFNFPYIYSSEAFSNQTSEGGFNKEVIEAFIKSKKIKMSEVEIIAVGFMNIPEIDLEIKLSLQLISLIRELKGEYPLVVNDFSVLTKDAILSYETCIRGSQNVDAGEDNELANISIYPQLIPTDIPIITGLDRFIAEKINTLELGYSPGQKITFSGSRFSRPVVYEYLDWILAFDLIRKPGIYSISLDRNNVIPLFGLVSKYKPDTNLDPSPYLESLGTLINSPGETECLLTSDVETGQFFDVKKDNFYVVPMLPKTKYSLAIKNHNIGNLKEVVPGGRVGLVVNTTSVSLFNNVKVFNDCVKQLSLCSLHY